MPTLTIKRLPDELYHQLKARTEANRRSLNSEILVCLERAVRATPVEVAGALTRIDALRCRFKGPAQEEKTINAAKCSARA